jgi:hypothetical protein
MAARPAAANLGDTLSWLRTYTPPFFKDRIGLRRSKLHAEFDALESLGLTVFLSRTW